MVYAELNQEVCGAFSGDGGGGLFYFNEDHEASVSDDYGEFDTLLLGDYENVGNKPFSWASWTVVEPNCHFTKQYQN